MTLFLSNHIFPENQICLQRFRVGRWQSFFVWLAASSLGQNLLQPARAGSDVVCQLGLASNHHRTTYLLAV